ncbi:MAG: hypothetical protein H7144_02340 [Burkholderiales bacterium]|nr:hypothetical protein [Phycisphaerae bacterium]
MISDASFPSSKPTISDAKLQANRQNALKSTGPRSVEGKARSAMNAIRHGLCAAAIVAPGEDLSDFELIRDQLFIEHDPQTVVETVLVTQLAHSAWRMSRLAGAEAKAIEQNMTRFGKKLDAAGALGHDIGSHNSMLNRLQIYQMRQERAFYRALNELRKVKKEGEGLGDRGQGSGEDDLNERSQITSPQAPVPNHHPEQTNPPGGLQDSQPPHSSPLPGGEGTERTKPDGRTGDWGQGFGGNNSNERSQTTKPQAPSPCPHSPIPFP